MLPSEPDIALDKFKAIRNSYPRGLSESDTRSKIIDPIFLDILGWNEKDIVREPHVNTGYIDYIFSINNMPLFVLEAKNNGTSFIVPTSLNRRQYVIGGTIWNQQDIQRAISQAQKYAISSGAKYAVICNGNQFIIFEAFRSGPWMNGYCTIFNSHNDIEKNFPLFWNIFSKQGILGGSLQTYISKTRPMLKFKKPLEFFHYQDISVSQNKYAVLLSPFVNLIFDEIIDDNQIDILKECYVHQKQYSNAQNRLVTHFDQLPHYSKKYGIENFYETEAHAGKFQVTFERCSKFLRQESPEGSLILLLGGIGCGKTTFIHHFFNVQLENKQEVLWFYVDFRESLPDPDKIEEYIFQSIIDDYERKYEERFGKELEEVGFLSPSPTYESILQLFSILKFKEYSIALVLDNADQHSLDSSEFQERTFLLSQYLTKNLKTITILTLREESFFKSTMSGVIGAYSMIANKFHIASPRFEQIVRNRIYYMINLLKHDDAHISTTLKTYIKTNGYKELISMFFKILNQSLSSKRPTGREILRFIDNMSGGDIRRGLYFFNTFILSGNTDVDDMLNKEIKSEGYPIPFHYIIKSIILENARHYSMSHSQIMNIFDVNPNVSNSHFVNLRILDHLNIKINNYSMIGKGYVPLTTFLVDAQSTNHSHDSIIDSLKKLAFYGLIEFDNQSRTGYDTSEYIRITKTGVYFLDRLSKRVTYLDLMWGDTSISDQSTVTKLRKLINLEKYDSELEMTKMFERIEYFLNYLEKMEKNEWNDFPQYQYSTISNEKFMQNIIKKYSENKTYILSRMTRSGAR